MARYSCRGRAPVGMRDWRLRTRAQPAGFPVLYLALPSHIVVAPQPARPGLSPQAAASCAGARDGATVGTAAWEREFDRWLAPFRAALGDSRRRPWGPVYVRGLQGPGDRKSVEPLTARVDVVGSASPRPRALRCGSAPGRRGGRAPRAPPRRGPALRRPRRRRRGDSPPRLGQPTRCRRPARASHSA